MSDEKKKQGDPPVVGYRAPPLQPEWSWPQTIALYIAVFCATGAGMVLIALAAAWLLHILGIGPRP